MLLLYWCTGVLVSGARSRGDEFVVSGRGEGILQRVTTVL